MRLYNTLSKEKEVFAPLSPPLVSIYTCGPTVYARAHIGNLRAYVFMDQLRRVLQWNQYSLRHVMNITDVGHLTDDADDGEDKMLKNVGGAFQTPWDIAAHFTEQFLNDLDALRVQRPEIIPKATEHIQDMLDFVQGLCERGLAYETSDGIYFDIARFPGYGKLSGTPLEDQLAGARVEKNPEKRHPADFALWKKAPKEHIMQWPSPWGMGYPGWHIECSAMSKRYLGERFDIHTGGVDHIPIHHENEIAQSEGLTGHMQAHTWLHNEFVLVDGGKMSKSLGNVYSLDDLREKGYLPEHFRYLCLNAHYRSKLNFTWDNLSAARTALDRLKTAVGRMSTAASDGDERVAAQALAAFEDAINDDLNIPKALGVLWKLVKQSEASAESYKLILRFDTILGLGLDAQTNEAEAPMVLDDEIEAMVNARQQARKAKNFAEADRIRDLLKGKGIVLEDTPQGVKWRKADA